MPHIERRQRAQAQHTRRQRRKLVVRERERGQLRELAGTELTVPFTGDGGPMADSAIHLRDAARPLGLDVSPDLDAWRATLDFLVSKPATRGFVTRKRLAGLRLVATDQDWSWGAGEEVRGPSEAVAMAVAGRPVALDDLAGDGVQVLRGRLSA